MNSKSKLKFGVLHRCTKRTSDNFWLTYLKKVCSQSIHFEEAFNIELLALAFYTT